MDWRKASYSGSNGSCVETASGNGVVLVRDTTDRDGMTLEVSAEAWKKFLGTLRLGLVLGPQHRQAVDRHRAHAVAQVCPGLHAHLLN